MRRDDTDVLPKYFGFVRFSFCLFFLDWQREWSHIYDSRYSHMHHGLHVHGLCRVSLGLGNVATKCKQRREKRSLAGPPPISKRPPRNFLEVGTDFLEVQKIAREANFLEVERNFLEVSTLSQIHKEHKQNLRKPNFLEVQTNFLEVGTDFLEVHKTA